MIQFLTSHLPFLRKYRRKRLHRLFVYDSMLELRNEAVRIFLHLDMPEYRQQPKVTSDDKPKIILAKKKLSLANKYKRRLTLLEF